MIKRIEIHGQRIKLYSVDYGHTLTTSPQAVLVYKSRQQLLRLELQR